MASPKGAGGSPPKDVLSDMSPEARKDAFKKMLVASSPILVFQETASQPIEFFSPDQPAQSPALALAKCREYDEQESNRVFYSSNHFNLVDTTTQRETSILEAFLISLTLTHTRLLFHLSLSFPPLEEMQEQPDARRLKQDGVQALKLLQVYCNNLGTLEFYVHKGNAFGLVEEATGDPQSSSEALSQVETQLKAIPSLKKIVIRYYHGKPPPRIMQLMQGLGWVVLVGGERDNLI